MSIQYNITHTTIYRYKKPVSFGEHRVMFRPRDSHDLRVLATDLQVKVGDRVRMTYHQIGSHGELPEVEQVLRVAGIVAMTGPAIDRGLAPQVRGITDAASLADWEQPFPMDLDRVTQRDDDYWNQYRATPKLFVSLASGRQLWPSRFGSATSLLLAVPAGKSTEDFAEEVRVKLLSRGTNR
jgi:hypothetical protein